MMLGSLPHPHLPSSKVMVAMALLMEAVAVVVITMAAVTMAAEVVVVVEDLKDTILVEDLLNLPHITAITLNHHLDDPKIVSIAIWYLWSMLSCRGLHPT